MHISASTSASSTQHRRLHRLTQQLIPHTTASSSSSSKSSSSSSNDNDVILLSSARTPIGQFLGSLSSLSAPELCSHAIRACLEKTGLKATDIEEAIIGNVVSSGIGQSCARQSCMLAGLPVNVVCTNVNKVCASGMKALTIGAQQITLGLRDVVLVGGTESMSNAPYYVKRGSVSRMGDQQLIDGMMYGK
jgi:acetyl-CoA C-acetyltransferase